MDQHGRASGEGSERADHVTRHLSRLSDGDRSAAEQLLPLVYDELRAMAGSFFRQERPDHTLEPTALVHEVYIKLVNQRDAQWNDRAHFLAVAGTALRRLLIDHARTRNALKRGGGGGSGGAGADGGRSGMTFRGGQVSLDVVEDESGGVACDVLSIDESLEKLASLHPRQSRVVEMRFFGGMTFEEVAQVLGVSPNTAKNDWRFARVWLQRELERDI